MYVQTCITEVLSFVWRMAGMQFAGVTQLLPMGVSSQQAALALEAFLKVLDGKVPQKGHEALKIAKSNMMWQEYRTSTKNLLCAIANSLKQVLPDSWNLSHAKPPNQLRPRGVAGERFFYLPEEMVERKDPEHFQCAFVHDFKTGVRAPDLYVSEEFYRLTFSADEGTEVGQFFIFQILLTLN